MMQTFHEELNERGEAFIDECERHLVQLRDLAELLYRDSIHDAALDLAEKASIQITACVVIENLLLEHTPYFKESQQ